MNRTLKSALCLTLAAGCNSAPLPRNNPLDPNVTSNVTISVQRTSTPAFTVTVDFGGLQSSPVVAGEVFSLARTTLGLFCDRAVANPLPCGPPVVIAMETAPMSRQLTVSDVLTTLPGGSRSLVYSVSTSSKIWATTTFQIPDGDLDNDNAPHDCNDLNPAVLDCDNGGSCEWASGTCVCAPDFSGSNCDECVSGCDAGPVDSGPVQPDAGPIADGGFDAGAFGDGGRDAGARDGGDGGPSPGPIISTFQASPNSLTQGQSVTFGAVLTDALGLQALDGGVLESPDGTVQYGAFVAGSPGEFSLSLTWTQINQDSTISFTSSEARSFEGVFFDNFGNSTSREVSVTLACDGMGACAGRCLDLTGDFENCGACGNVCAAGGSCVNSACVCPGNEVASNGNCQCPTGTQLCGSTCVSTQTNSSNCGTCGNACPATAACTNGGCVCPSGELVCNGNCVTESLSNCGTCGVVCSQEANSTPECVNHLCALMCTSGYGDCDGTLSTGCETNVESSAADCGTCGHACPSGATCSSGQCNCPGGETACGSACVSTMSSLANCGTCGFACPSEPNSIVSCVSGQCVFACATGYANCGSSSGIGCGNYLPTDSQNCGICGNACPSGGFCSNAQCQCPGGEVACNGACVNMSMDTNACGACGTVCPAVANGSAVCSSGHCGVNCTSGFTDCSGACVNETSDIHNCGGCGNACPTVPNSNPVCMPGGECEAACDVDYANCDGLYENGCEVDLETNAANCGACGNTCAVGASCVSGQCECPAGETSTCGGVCQVLLDSIAVTPDTPNIPLGLKQQLTATGSYADGSMKTITTNVSWISSSNSVATVGSDTGLVASIAQGSTDVTAKLCGVVGTATVSVGPPSVVSISLMPANGSLPLGKTVQIYATATYSNGTTADVTHAAGTSWTSGSSSIAIVSGGLVSTKGVGTAVVSATLNGTVGSADVTVEPAALVSISISPSTLTFPLGDTGQLMATGTYTDSTTKDITSTVTWTTNVTGIAEFSTTAAGLVIGETQGDCTATATLGAVSKSISVVVEPPALVSIAVTPTSSFILGPGGTVQLTAIGTYTNQTMATLTTAVTWESFNTGVVQVSLAGVVTGIGAGSTDVVAVSGDIESNEVAITVD